MEVVKNEQRVAYMSQNKFRTGRQEAMLEAELAELKKAHTEEAPKPDKQPEQALSAEEETWKKRYGDLRAYNQRQVDDLTKKVTDLASQLEAATKQEIKYPKSETEIQEWATKYPDVYNVMKTMAMKEVAEARKELNDVKSELKKNERLADKQRAYAKLVELHPDFPELIKTKEMQDWLKDQRQSVQDTLLVNDTDPYSAAETVDLYKYHLLKAGAPKREAETRQQAAQAIVTKSAAPDVGGDTKVWSDTRVKALSDRDYAKYRSEIAEARRNGTYVYDLVEGGAF